MMMKTAQKHNIYKSMLDGLLCGLDSPNCTPLPQHEDAFTVQRYQKYEKLYSFKPLINKI